MSEPIIEISNVDFAYGERLVLKHISICVARDDGGVIGPNGGGKTTLMKLLLALLKPTRGTISVAGMPAAAGLAVSRRMSIVMAVAVGANVVATLVGIAVSRFWPFIAPGPAIVAVLFLGVSRGILGVRSEHEGECVTLAAENSTRPPP